MKTAVIFICLLLLQKEHLAAAESAIQDDNLPADKISDTLMDIFNLDQDREALPKKRLCTDTPNWSLNGDGEHTCQWFMEVESKGLSDNIKLAVHCPKYGHRVGKGGGSAHQHCCFCGGGRISKSTSNNDKVKKNPRVVPHHVGCKDKAGWSLDNDGKHTCKWFQENDDYSCPKYGYRVGKSGESAHKNCCWCTGGNLPTANPTKAKANPEPAKPALPTPPGKPSPTPAPTKCVDSPNRWVDSHGDGCGWYFDAAYYYEERCRRFGHGWAGTDGLTANQVCCFCKKQLKQKNIQGGSL